MAIPSFEQIISTIITLVIGAGGGIGGIFVTGFSREYFEERERKAKHKRNVARSVLKICNEASASTFKNPPRDNEHVISVLTDLEGIDRFIAEEMTSFINLWRRRSEIKNVISLEDNHFAIELKNDAENKRKHIIAWANKITSGN